MGEQILSAATADLPPAQFKDALPVGEGAFGLVYRARDAAGRDVAVKVLSAGPAGDPRATWRFTAEYRRLTRLAHPAFPCAYEEGRTGAGRPYYSMEFVAGDPPPAAPLPAARVRAVLLAVARALAYLHGLGLVHGDLKAENLVLQADGGVRVLDVGLTAPVGQRREAIAGTLEYLAPEVLRKAPVDPAADLYALGALAFRLWTGVLPYRGEPTALVRAHLTAPVPSPAGLAADADPALEALVTSLLAKEPAARPASAGAVLAALGVPEDQLPPAAHAPVLAGGAFVGRGDLLSYWQRLLGGAGGGGLAVSGTRGLGKTRALDELRLAAQVAGRTWLGAASLGEADAPGAVARTVVGQAAAAAGLAPDPIVAAWLAGEEPPQLADLEPPARRAAIHAAAATLLERAAAALGGLAVGLDDWHLADGASREWAAAMRRTTAGDVVWAIAFDPQAGPAPAGDDPTFTLAPLDEAESGALLASRLGADAPPELAARVLSTARGLPLLLDLLLEHLVASGQLRREAGRVRFVPAAGPVGPADLPAILARLWETRQAELAEPARRLAAVAAVAQPAGEVAVPLLALAAGLDEADTAAAVDQLLAAGLVVVAAGALRLALPAMADVLARPLEPAARERVAGELARALAGGPAALAGPTEALPLDALAQSAALALAGDDPALAARLAGEAGRRALAMSAPAEAVRFLGAALERLAADAPTAERLALVLPRADARRILDRMDEAIADYEAALPLTADDGRAEARALIGLAKCLQMRGLYPTALDHLARAVTRAAACQDTTQQARALVAEARIRLFQRDVAAALANCRRAAELARAGKAPAVLALALNLQGALVAQEDPRAVEEALRLLEEAMAISEGLGDRLGVASALENLGNVQHAAGDLRAAADVFRRHAAVCRELGAHTELLFAELNLAYVLAERGDGDEAAPLAAAVEARAEAAGRAFPRALAMAVGAQAALRAGRPAAAVAACDRALSIATEIANRYLEELVRFFRVEALLATGQLRAAHEEIERLGELVRGQADEAARLACFRGDLALLEGDLKEVVAAVFARVTSPSKGAAHRARQLVAEVALRQGRAEEAARQARAALAIAEGWEAPWHIAADRLLEARARHALDARNEALALARAVAAGPNPYARAGAGLLLATLGEGKGARDITAAALERLRPGLLELPPEQRGAVLAAWGLAELEPLMEAAPGAPGSFVAAEGLTIDDAKYLRLAEALAAETDEPRIARRAIEAMMELIGAQRGYWLVYEGDRLREAHTRGLDYQGEGAASFSRSIVERVMATREPLYLANASADETWREAASITALGLRTVVCLPVAAAGEVVGVLYMDRQAIEPFLTPGDMALLAAFATFTGSAIARERSRARLVTTARRRRARAVRR